MFSLLLSLKIKYKGNNVIKNKHVSIGYTTHQRFKLLFLQLIVLISKNVFTTDRMEVVRNVGPALQTTWSSIVE